MSPYSAAFVSAQGLVEAAHLADREERHEQLLAIERALERQPGDRRGDEVAAIEDPAAEAMPSDENGPFAPGPGHRAFVPLDRRAR